MSGPETQLNRQPKNKQGDLQIAQQQAIELAIKALQRKGIKGELTELRVVSETSGRMLLRATVSGESNPFFIEIRERLAVDVINSPRLTGEGKVIYQKPAGQELAPGRKQLEQPQATSNVPLNLSQAGVTQNQPLSLSVDTRSDFEAINTGTRITAPVKAIALADVNEGNRDYNHSVQTRAETGGIKLRNLVRGLPNVKQMQEEVQRSATAYLSGNCTLQSMFDVWRSVGIDAQTNPQLFTTLQVEFWKLVEQQLNEKQMFKDWLTKVVKAAQENNITELFNLAAQRGLNIKGLRSPIASFVSTVFKEDQKRAAKIIKDLMANYENLKAAIKAQKTQEAIAIKNKLKEQDKMIAEYSRLSFT